MAGAGGPGVAAVDVTAVETVGVPLTGRELEVFSVSVVVADVAVGDRLICGVGIDIWGGGWSACALGVRDKLEPLVEEAAAGARAAAESSKPMFVKAACRPLTAEGPGLLIG